ncbi:MAG: type II toxin-antitoxin system PemK/MazF family toxin [Deltaproteobacteria bacterium]|nr:type II toxin-antitoxin system PemK/MazF family toxin [Deltaproteobacteria bacterium]
MNYEERWVDFNPPTGAEIQKKRPAVIISNNTANQFFNRVQVIPLTSNADKLYPSETYFTIKGEKAMTDQLTMVSKHRLTNKTDTISKNELEGIMQAIAIQLDL